MKNKVRILVISNYRSPEYIVRPEAEIFVGLAQKKDVYEIDVMSFDRAKYKDRFKASGIQYISHHPEKKWDAETIKLIRQKNEEREYDIVHAFNNKAITCAIKALKGSKTKLITYRGVTGYSDWYDPTSYLTHLHPRVDAITCVAEAASEYLRKQLWNKKKVFTVYKGHAKEWYDGVPAIDLYDEDVAGIKLDESLPIGICVANVRKMKGVKYLLQATNLLPENAHFNLLLIGSGMDHPSFLKLMDESKMRQHIHVLGFKDDVLSWIKGSDFLILPSIKGEGLPKVVIEAMMQEVVPIATNVGGGPELIENGISGYIAKKKSPEKLADAISHACQHLSELKIMGRASKERIMTHFNLKSSIERMHEVYQIILAR